MPQAFKRLVIVAGVLVLGALLVFWLFAKQTLSVTGYALEPKPLVQRVIASGTVTSAAIAQVGSEITGTIKKRHVYEGDRVSAGDLLIELRDEREQAKLAQAKATLDEALNVKRPQAHAAWLEAKANFAQAQAELNRRQQLFAKNLLAKEALELARVKVTTSEAALTRTRTDQEALGEQGSLIEQLSAAVESAKVELAKTQIRAQVSGTVLTRSVEAGDQVQPGRTLLTIAQQDATEILVPVDEKLIAPLAVGQQAWITADAFADRPVQATIRFIAPNIDSNRGTLDVRLLLDEPAAFLRQGMTITADIHTARQEDALVVSNDALFARKANSATVYKWVNNQVTPTPVTLGLQTNAASQILTGAKAHDVLLNAPVSEGQRIKVTLMPIPAAFVE